METKLSAADIEVVETKLFSAAVADEIVASINDAISDRGKCSLVLAGGKTPSVIYRTIARPPRVGEIDWGNVSLYFGDERWVPREDTQSNYKMVHETLLSFLSAPEPCVCAVDTKLASPHDGAAAYGCAIRENFNLAAGQVPVFDLVLLGIGEDGHTASIFPGSKMFDAAIDDSSIVTAAVQSPSDGSWRVSLSPAVLIAAKKIIYIVRGEGKSQALKHVLEGETNIRNYPAQIYRQAKGHVTFFLDSAAAQQISVK